MDAKTKKILTSVAVVLAVIVADKMFGVSDKAVSKLGGRQGSANVHVPRTRGDEPMAEAMTTMVRICSPHTRG